jgi:hypothetical protein
MVKSTEERLATAGIELPPAVTPFGAYVPAVRTPVILKVGEGITYACHSTFFIAR